MSHTRAERVLVSWQPRRPPGVATMGRSGEMCGPPARARLAPRSRVRAALVECEAALFAKTYYVTTDALRIGVISILTSVRMPT